MNAPLALSLPADPWLASRDALDLASDIMRAANDISHSGNTLMDDPRNLAAMADAEAAARRTLALVGRLRSMAR